MLEAIMPETNRKLRLAYFVSHPIQYQVPLLRLLSENRCIDLKVFYISDLSVGGYHDQQFGRMVEWDIPLLDGYRYEFLPAIGARKPLGFLRPFTYGIKRRLVEEGFDYVWTHGWAQASNLAAVVAAKQLGIKVLMRGESTLHLRSGSQAKQLTKSLFYKWLFSKIDGFLAIGTWNREFYRYWNVPESRIGLVPYAVDNRSFQARASAASVSRETFRNALGLQPGRPVILYAGKLTPRKRAADLLDAYVLLSPDRKREPDPYLLIVGDGETRSELETQVSTLGWNSVRFLGFRNQSELPQLYDLCDIFVLPSFGEPWGLVVNEAMNAGRAVIVSDQVGCGPDLVKDGVNGKIFPAGDVDRLYASLEAVLRDRRYIDMGRKSLEIIDGWGYEQDVAGLLETMHSLENSQNRPSYEQRPGD